MLDNPGRNTAADAVRRYFLGHNRASSHHRTVSDMGSIQYRDFPTQPDIVFDHTTAVGADFLGSYQLIGVVKLIVPSADDIAARTDNDVVANRCWALVRRLDYSLGAQSNTIANS